MPFEIPRCKPSFGWLPLLLFAAQRFDHGRHNRFQGFAEPSLFGLQDVHFTRFRNDQQTLRTDIAPTTEAGASAGVLGFGRGARARTKAEDHTDDRHNFRAVKIPRGAQHAIGIQHSFHLRGQVADQFIGFFGVLPSRGGSETTQDTGHHTPRESFLHGTFSLDYGTRSALLHLTNQTFLTRLTSLASGVSTAPRRSRRGRG